MAAKVLLFPIFRLCFLIQKLRFLILIWWYQILFVPLCCDKGNGLRRGATRERSRKGSAELRKREVFSIWGPPF